MKKILLIILIIFFLTPEVLAFKTYYYNSQGERVYITVTPEMSHKNKSKPRYSYVRKCRTNWEITPAMRLRKKTLSQYANRTKKNGWR